MATQKPSQMNKLQVDEELESYDDFLHLRNIARKSGFRDYLSPLTPFLDLNIKLKKYVCHMCMF